MARSSSQPREPRPPTAQQPQTFSEPPRLFKPAAYELFRGTGSEAALAETGKESPGALFYSLLYTGLFAEANGREEPARAAITAAAETPYARESGDYMAGLAAVHCSLRGWPVAA